MTVNEMVEQLSETLSTPSPEAKTRIAREINTRYKRTTSSIGMVPTRRQDVTQNATIGSSLMTFSDVEKLFTVWRVVGVRNMILDEFTKDEMTNAHLHDEPPTAYCINSFTPNSVTIKLNCTPSTTFALNATALVDATTLSNNDQPLFPESFHDILIFGVLSDEYRRREKTALAQENEQMYENRLSDLRMFIAKSAWLDVHRGKHTKTDGWWDYSRNFFQ